MHGIVAELFIEGFNHLCFHLLYALHPIWRLIFQIRYILDYPT